MNNLKKYLKENNIVVCKIAAILGIERKCFFRYLKDSSRITGKNAKKLVEHFPNLDYNFIYDYKGK